MELVTIGIMVLLSIGLVAYSAMPARQQVRDALKRRLEGRGGIVDERSAGQKPAVTTREAFVKKAAPMLSKLIMPVSSEEQTNLRLKLTQAGYRHRQASTLFLASKTVGLVLGLGIGGVLGPILGYSVKAAVGLLVFCGAMGFIAPGFLLGMQVSARRDKLRRGLPDVLDLLVVSVESGLALDSGIKRVGEEMAMVHPELSEEFRIATAEAQMGIPRSEALDNMARRTDVDEIRSLVSVVTQAERFGTSIAKALRNQGEALRTKRRQEAEERAQKTAVKLMIPLVCCIFPAMGIVLAGPAAIRLMEAFAK